MKEQVCYELRCTAPKANARIDALINTAVEWYEQELHSQKDDSRYMYMMNCPERFSISNTDKDDAGTLIRELTINQSRDLVGDGVIAGGMIPKVECCVKSIAQGVKSAHIIDGRAPHSLLLEIVTDEGAGTMITG